MRAAVAKRWRQVIALGRTLAEEGQPDLTDGLNYRLLP